MAKTVLVAVLLVSASSFASPPATLEVQQERFRHPLVGDPKVRAELRLPGDAWGAAVTVPGGAQLVALELRSRANDRHPRQLLVDIEPGHHYYVGPDPCCFVAIVDADSTLRPEASASAICDGHAECVAPYTSVPSFVAQDPRCGEAHVCVRYSEVRFEVAPSAAAAGSLSVRVGGHQSPTFVLDKDLGWQRWPWTRHDSPTSVELWRGKTRVWAREVQLRLEHRYVIAVGGDGSQVTISRQD